MSSMGEALVHVFPVTVDADGLVALPAQVALVLGVEPGDSAVFVVDAEGTVGLTTSRAMAEHVWAHNTGVPAGNLDDFLAECDQSETDAVAAKWERIDSDADGSDADIEDVLRALLALPDEPVDVADVDTAALLADCRASAATRRSATRVVLGDDW